MFCRCLIFYRPILFFNDLFQTNYLDVYWTDIREICRVCRTTVVDERSEVIFFDFSEGVATATNFLLTVFPHICRAISPKRHEIAIHRVGQKNGATDS